MLAAEQPKTVPLNGSPLGEAKVVTNAVVTTIGNALGSIARIGLGATAPPAPAEGPHVVDTAPKQSPASVTHVSVRRRDNRRITVVGISSEPAGGLE